MPVTEDPAPDPVERDAKELLNIAINGYTQLRNDRLKSVEKSKSRRKGPKSSSKPVVLQKVDKVIKGLETLKDREAVKGEDGFGVTK